jgi:hypothetical protein
MNSSRALAARRSHVPRPLGDLRLSAWPETRAHLQTWTTAGGPSVPAGAPGFAWSKQSNLYHDSRCRFVATISPANLQTGTTPPPGKTLHKDCPK